MLIFYLFLNFQAPYRKMFIAIISMANHLFTIDNHKNAKEIVINFKNNNT